MSEGAPPQGRESDPLNWYNYLGAADHVSDLHGIALHHSQDCSTNEAVIVENGFKHRKNQIRTFLKLRVKHYTARYLTK